MHFGVFAKYPYNYRKTKQRWLWHALTACGFQLKCSRNSSKLGGGKKKAYHNQNFTVVQCLLSLVHFITHLILALRKITVTWPLQDFLSFSFSFKFNFLSFSALLSRCPHIAPIATLLPRGCLYVDRCFPQIMHATLPSSLGMTE